MQIPRFESALRVLSKVSVNIWADPIYTFESKVAPFDIYAYKKSVSSLG